MATLSPIDNNIIITDKFFLPSDNTPSINTPINYQTMPSPNEPGQIKPMPSPNDPTLTDYPIDSPSNRQNIQI